jgi:hypothetical protein
MPNYELKLAFLRTFEKTKQSDPIESQNLSGFQTISGVAATLYGNVFMPFYPFRNHHYQF